MTLPPATRTLTLCLALTGCADIDGYAAGECGNNVVEPEAGEDCDLIADPALGGDLVCGPADGGPQQCRYVCDGAECPVGWACEDDGICRPPSGTFESDDDPVVRLAAQQIALHNLLGTEQAQLVTRRQGDVLVFATDDEAFEPVIELTIPDNRGDLHFADVDEDGLIDVVAPAVSRALSNDAAPRIHVLRAEAERLVTAVVPQRLAPERIVATTTVDVFDGGGQTPLLAVLAPDGGLAVRLDDRLCGANGPGSRVPVASLSGMLAVSPTIVELAGLPHAAVTAEGADTVMLLSLVEPCSLPPTLVGQIALPEAVDAGGCLALDVGADGDLDLVCHGPSGLSLATSDGVSLSDASPDPDFATLDDLPPQQSRACAGTRRVLAAADLDGDGATDLVTPHGIFTASPAAGYTRTYARESADAWGEAVVGDFDRDGNVDVVATALDAEAGCSPVQLTMLTQTQGAFSPRSVRDGALAHDLTVGDFDGDAIDDVAAALPGTDDTRVAVFFGDTKEALEDVTFVGGFAEVTAVGALHSVADAPVNPDRIDDLFIVSEGGEFTTLVRGTTSRTLLAPLAPADEGPGLGRRLAHVLAGPLRPTAAQDADAPADVLALYGEQGWLYRGDDVHHGDDPVSVDLIGIGLRSACATWQRGPGSDRGALIAGIDGHVPRVGDIDVACDLALPPMLVVARLDGAEVAQWRATTVPTTIDARRPTGIVVVDFDQDEREDVLVHFSHAGTTARGSVHWLPGADPTSPDTQSLQPLLVDFDVRAIAVLDADADPAPELALWTASGLRIADLDPARDPALIVSESLVDVPTTAFSEPAVGLVAGDLDGDDLDDLALLWGDGVYLYPAVPRP